jgi:hypothetical protein
VSIASAFHILGLEPGASLGEVEHAYRRLVREHHPDAGGSHEDAVRIIAAHDTARAWLESRPEPVAPSQTMDACENQPAPPESTDVVHSEATRPSAIRVVVESATSLVLMRMDFVVIKARLIPRLWFVSEKTRERLRRETQSGFEDYWWERYSAWWDAYAALPPTGRRGLFDYPRWRLFGNLRY